MATATDNWRAKRIQGYEPLEGSTIRGKLAVAVGTALVAITAGLNWVAFGELPTWVDRPNLPPLLFSLFVSGIFGLPGLFVLYVGVRDLYRDRRVADLRAMHGDQPWQWDFVWHPYVSYDLSLRLALTNLLGLVMAIGIIGPVNYVVFTEDAPIFAWLGVGFFDLVLALSASTVLYRLGARVFHGRGEVRYQEFPLRLSETIRLELLTNRRMAEFESLKCTLRCVQEQCLHRKTGNFTSPHRNTNTVTKIGLQHYIDEQLIDVPRNSDRIGLAFQLPDAKELATRLSAVDGRHWELIVAGEGEGIALSQRYLLPVY